MQWYYAIDGQRLGPVSQTEFERLVHAGSITPGTLVWRKPMPAWQSLADVLAADPSAVATPETVPPPLPTSTPGAHADVHPNSMPSPAATPDIRVRITAAAPVVYGGFWRRVAARLIDGFILWFAWQIVIGIVGGLFFPESMQTLEKLNGHQPTPEQALSLLGFLGMACGVSLLLGLAYDCVFLRKYSATPGKLALGLAIRRADGSPLSLGRIIARYFAIMLNIFTLGLSYLAIAFDGEKRGIHDCICDTRVVRAERR